MWYDGCGESCSLRRAGRFLSFEENMKKKFRPVICGAIVLFHLLAVYAVWYGVQNGGFSVAAWIWTGVMLTISMFGISVGYHRFFTHQSFECGPRFECFLAACGATALEGSIEKWCRDHAQHHRFADQAGDPHSPGWPYLGIRGFLWSHVVWLFWVVVRPSFRAPDFSKSVGARWQRLWYWPTVVAGFALPAFFVGWDGFWLAGIIRVVAHWHITWGVNSVCHLWGVHPVRPDGRPYTKDASRNNLLLIILAYLGEGFHGYHHAQPNAAFFGWGKWSLDVGKWIIILLEKLGVVWGVRRPSKS